MSTVSTVFHAAKAKKKINEVMHKVGLFIKSDYSHSGAQGTTVHRCPGAVDTWTSHLELTSPRRHQSSRKHCRQFRRKSHIPNMVGTLPEAAVPWARELGVDSYPLGRPRRLHLHPWGQGCPVEAVSRDAAVSHRSSPRILPQASRQRNPAYHGRTGQRPICLPAP